MLRAGIGSVVINTGWLGDQIEPALGDRFQPEDSTVESTALSDGIQLHYSHEGRGAGEALETAGGIVRALPLLKDVFWVAAGDVFTPDFDFSHDSFQRFVAGHALAHIWLVPNPAHNPQGDFGLSAEGLALNLPRATTTSQISADTNDVSLTGTVASATSDVALHLQHHRALQKNIFQRSPMRPSHWQPALRQSAAGPLTASRHGRGFGDSFAVPRPVGGCGNAGAVGATE
jgi:MurNAc alpha-1-phosphate uridylyltransferase